MALLFDVAAETLRTIAAKCGAPHLAANAVDIVMRGYRTGSEEIRGVLADSKRSVEEQYSA